MTTYPTRNYLLLEGISQSATEQLNKGLQRSCASPSYAGADSGTQSVPFVVNPEDSREPRNQRDARFQGNLLKRALNEEELINELNRLAEKGEPVHLLGIRSKTHVTRTVLECPGACKLQAIGCFGIGTNQVDLSETRHRGIMVFNSPFCNSRSVAELVIGYIITLARQLGDRNNELHEQPGLWRKTAQACYEIRGKTLGIVGYGHIGSQLSVLAENLGMKVLYYDIEKKLALGNAHDVGNLLAVISQSDFVSLHVPATPETVAMISEQELSVMKDGSYLINASRGNVIDMESLVKYLTMGKLAGVALDVYQEEPEESPSTLPTEHFINILARFPNVIMTPHIGGSTQEAQLAIGLDVTEKYMAYTNYGTTTGAVNFPELEIKGGARGLARICNVHQNRPGVLAEINTILAKYNIVHQQLGTQGEIGYLLCDLEISDAKELREQIQKLDSSIRTRIRY